jgi:sugar lactone lactonase YvrE
VLVSITPCRLFDTRPAPDNVGARNTPLSGNETATFQVTGSNGNCVIPGDATTVVMNVTAVGATAGTFLTIWPADAAQPLSSNLNPSSGAPPAPNLVTVKLSAGGAINVFNKAGTVDVLADIVGYYASHAHDDRYYTETEINTKVPAAGQACTVAGLSGTIVEGWDAYGNRNQKCVRNVVTTITNGGFGSANGPAASAGFYFPRSMAVAADGSIIVADTSNHRIRRIAPNGTVTTLAGTGSAGDANGPATSATFFFPSSVAVAADGSIIVADTDNHRIRRIATDGTVTTVAGSNTSGFVDGPAASAKFSAPYGVAVAADGSIVVADLGNHRIRRIATDGTVSTVAGSGASGWQDGPAASAQFSLPRGVAVAADGSIIVADTSNHRIRRIATDGTVTTIAGGNTSGLNDGTGAIAAFNAPNGVAVAADGSIIVADTGNHRIRRID